MSKDIYRTLKFKIGEDLKHRMHEVIPIPPVGNLEEGTHPYEYFGDINKILNIPTSRIILFFRAQVLVKVLMVFGINFKTQLIEMLESIDTELPEDLHLSIKTNASTNCIELAYHTGITK